MDALLQDLRYALRSHMRSLGVFALAVLSLALGVAANTTIFSAVDVFLIRPLPYPSSEALVRVWTTNTERGWTEASSSLADYLDWRAASRTLQLAAYQESSHSITEGDRPEQLDGVRATADLFPVIGIPPVRGRAFTADEELLGAGPVVMISERLWERRYARDPSAVGATLYVDGEPRTIIGVVPASFQFPAARTDLFLPLGYDPSEVRTNRYLRIVGRLRPGASLDAARAELSGIARRLELEHPAENAGIGTNVLYLPDDMFNATFRTAAIICTTAVAFVLLIACANIANLLLARATARDREIAVRTVLGAGRMRIARQLLTESLVLALVGGALGLLLSHWGIQWLVSIMPESFPFVERIGIDLRVLAFTLGVSVAAGLLFGMAPAVQAARPRLASTLREAGARGATVGGRKGRLRGFLVAAEIGLALVLLISAGLLVRGYLHMQRADLGFEPAGVFTARFNLLRSEYPDSTLVTEFQERLVGRLETLPGVATAAVSSTLPMQGTNRAYYTIEGEAPVPDDRRPIAIFRIVSPGFFDALGIPLVSGRGFDRDDRTGGPPAMIVNEAFVRRHFPAGDAVGKRVALGMRTAEIVGVVADTRDFGPDSEPEPIMYTPASQATQRSLAIVIRTAGTPGSVAEGVRSTLAELDPRLPLYRISSMADIVREWDEGNILMAKLLGVFAGMALLLALIGVYGVMAYNVTQRTREVGIRMALGAERRDIVRLIVRQGAVLAAGGLLAGLFLALASARFLAAFIYGISPFDLPTFAAVTAALASAALVASWMPARRATRIDPVVALREE